MNYKIGVDVGGTFTDFLLMNEEGVTRRLSTFSPLFQFFVLINRKNLEGV